MFQEGTLKIANDTNSFRRKISVENFLGVFKKNNHGKSINKSKCQLQGCNNECTNENFNSFCSEKCHLSKPLPDPANSSKCESNVIPMRKTLTATSITSSSSATHLSPFSFTRPFASTSVTSFSDEDSIEPELTFGSSSKSLNYLPWKNHSSAFKHKISTSSFEMISSNDQDNLEGSVEMKKSNKKFKSIRRFRSFFNNHSTNSSNSEQVDSAYETSTEKDFKKKKEKSIKKTKMTTLSPTDQEYNEVEKFFSVGLPHKEILGIVRLQMPRKLVKAHKQYKIQTSKVNNVPELNVCHKMFHGTKNGLGCEPQRFIDQKKAGFCKKPCGVCGIAKEGNKTKFSRYSHQMWFANSSSTSQGYCSNTSVKVIFVVDVIAPVGGSILIVDKDAATLPKYLIVYK
ncbi:17781_t:CDS:2 [Funneliformis caledonium]|uniref:17781_t:CDS:1 n=1 Tax=Funneliformis caledonium TaxID=1117310 RepID=A0A9N8YW18_9GLOM|nr:17781_t:CDS:2 [Funneliformis caledonium]